MPADPTTLEPSPELSRLPAAHANADRLRRLVLRVLPNLIGLGLLGWFLHGLDTTGFVTAVRAMRPSLVAGIAAAAFVETSVRGCCFIVCARPDRALGDTCS